MKIPISATAMLMLIFGLSVSFAAAAGPPCDNARAIWASEKEDSRTIFYFGGKTDNKGEIWIGTFGPVFIEEWRKGKLAWRMRGEYECSMGASTCYVSFENNSTSDATESPERPVRISMTGAVIETIDVNEDQLDNWVVLAGLGQKLYYSGGARISWFNGFYSEDKTIPPNIYRYYGCRHGNKPVVHSGDQYWVGTWTYNNSCNNIDDIGQDGAPFRFTPYEYHGIEQVCDIIGQERDGEWTDLKLSCLGKGEHYTKTMTVNADKSILKIKDNEGDISYNKKCL